LLQSGKDCRQGPAENERHLVKPELVLNGVLRRRARESAASARLRAFEVAGKKLGFVSAPPPERSVGLAAETIAAMAIA